MAFSICHLSLLASGEVLKQSRAYLMLPDFSLDGRQPLIEDDLTNDDNLKNEDNLKKEENRKMKDNLKKETP